MHGCSKWTGMGYPPSDRSPAPGMSQSLSWGEIASPCYPGMVWGECHLDSQRCFQCHPLSPPEGSSQPDVCSLSPLPGYHVFPLCPRCLSGLLFNPRVEGARGREGHWEPQVVSFIAMSVKACPRSHIAKSSRNVNLTLQAQVTCGARGSLPPSCGTMGLITFPFPCEDRGQAKLWPGAHDPGSAPWEQHGHGQGI